MRRLHSLNKQTGLSLIELMIALVLGLIISGAALRLFTDTRQTFNTISATAQIQDSARFASEFVGRYLRMAGYRSLDRFGTKDTLSSNGDFQVNQGIVGTDSGGADSDSFSVRVGAGAGNDCAGNPITATTTMAFTVTNDGVLLCTINGDPQDPERLVDNIESMQLQYGIDTDGGPDKRPNRYDTADNITGTAWHRVVSVRVAFLVRSPAPTAPGLNQNYTVLEQTINSIGDNPRQVFETSVSLRNLMRVM